MATIQKSYTYKVSRNGRVLGNLPTPISDFTYDQDINSAGAQLTIQVPINADVSAIANQILTTEAGDYITDEAGNYILTERAPDVVGNDNPDIQIRNDNVIQVYEYSDGNLNGKLVYTGYISKWQSNIGGVDYTTITCLNLSQDLNHVLIPGSTVELTDQQQLTYNPASDYIFLVSPGLTTCFTSGIQQVTPGANVTNISAVEAMLSVSGTPVTFTASIYNSPSDFINGLTPLASVSKLISNNSPQAQKFTFASPLTIPPSTPYYIIITANTSDYTVNTANMFFISAANPYPLGEGYVTGFGIPSTFQLFVVGGVDQKASFYFKTYYQAPSTQKIYANQDPSVILTDLMTSYAASLGSVAYGAFGATGYSVGYTFNVQTILEGIRTVYALGPQNWYWYVDPATNTLYYQPVSTTADHVVIKGNQINEIDITASKEEIINTVYFSGGDDGSGHNINIFVKVTDATSLANNRVGLARLSDNGVHDVPTAQLLARNYIAQNNAETYRTKLVLTDAKTDITSYHVGQTVGFEGFGTSIDKLILTIVSITYAPDNIVLTLGTIPPRITSDILDIKNSLSAIQTEDNPTTPS